LIRRAKRLLWREASLLDEQQRALISATLEESHVLRIAYERRIALQQTRASPSGLNLPEVIRQWV
jgi:hypothetical protein